MAFLTGLKTKEGIASLFKVTQDNPLADIGTQLDLIEKEGKSLVDRSEEVSRPGLGDVS